MSSRRQVKRIESPELRWLARNRAYLEANHPGKWLAIKGDELVGLGDSLEEAASQADAKGIHDPFFSGIKLREYQGALLFRSPRFRNAAES